MSLIIHKICIYTCNSALANKIIWLVQLYVAMLYVQSNFFSFGHHGVPHIKRRIKMTRLDN
jgi:hypothetical protein